MKEELSAEQGYLLHLLKRSLAGDPGEDPQPEPECTREQWQRILSVAKKHAVLPLLYDVLEQNAALPQDLFAGVQALSRQTVRQSYKLLYLTNYIVKLLKREAVSVLVLKGVATAVLYPVPELRKSGDVDLLVAKDEDFARACTILKAHGFSVKEVQCAHHHVVLESSDGIAIEIHATLAEDFDNQRMNRYVDDLSLEYCSHIHERDILGSRLPVPEDAYHAYYLLLHMLQHFLRAGFGLKLLCDWVVFWNREVGETQKFLQMVRESGLYGFAQRVTAVCVEYLGLDKTRVGFLETDSLHRGVSEEFLLEILDAEEFGKSGTDRMVVMRGTSLVDYVREFHHQMCLNYPKARKIVAFWPVLWAGTLARFLYNNRKIRKTSCSAVLKKARARSKNRQEMKLFQGKK